MPADSAIATEPSEDPSSTTMLSCGGVFERFRHSRHCGRNRAPLSTGIMTEKVSTGSKPKFIATGCDKSVNRP